MLEFCLVISLRIVGVSRYHEFGDIVLLQIVLGSLTSVVGDVHSEVVQHCDDDAVEGDIDGDEEEVFGLNWNQKIQ